MLTSRHVLAATIVALSVIPAGSAVASPAETMSVDGAEAVRSLATEASELLVLEFDLIRLVAADGAPVTISDDLQRIDNRGQATLVQLQGLGVTLTPAIEATLDRLPAVTGDSDADAVPLFPRAVVYRAAVDDLARIAAVPSAVAPVGDGNRGPSYGLLLVAAISLLALGGAALANTLWRRPQSRELAEQTWNDGLTGLANRRRLDHDIANRSGETATTGVILIDVDHFKEFNDAYGRHVGDDILRRLGTLLAHHVRIDDVVYRSGDEEFCILLPDADPADTQIVADRIVEAAHSIDLPNGANITVSVGYSRTEGMNVIDAVDFADQALMRAKQQGRDCAVYADSVPAG
ncbi:MAG: GGDEF domain-containing protein [Ilumatobacteraceae bacterium]